MFNAIVDERAFEFCGEMTRKFDLIRWGILKEKMDAAKQKMKNLRDLTGEYAQVNMLGGDVYYQVACMTSWWKASTTGIRSSTCSGPSTTTR